MPEMPAADPIELARVCRGVNPNDQIVAAADLSEAYNRARELAAQEEHALIVITGSLFLVGEALHRLPLGLPGEVWNAELTLQ